MGKNARGKRNGTGPHKDSVQRRATGNRGKRKLAGQRCPKKKE